VTNAATSSSSATKAAVMIGGKATASFVAAVGQGISTRGYLQRSATF